MTWISKFYISLPYLFTLGTYYTVEDTNNDKDLFLIYINLQINSTLYNNPVII